MLDITRIAIAQRRITYTFLAMIVALGVMSYVALPKAEDPGFIVRLARVSTFFPGASPERVEKLVTDKLEKAIQEIPELDHIKSESLPGLSLITVTVNERHTNMRPIWDTLRRKVERASRELPKDTVGPIVNDEFGDVFGTLITIKGEGFDYRQLKDIADEVKNRLLYQDEVAKVELYGEQDERIFVEYRDAKIADLNSSALQLREVLESRNIITPGGSITTDQERIILEPSGNYETIEDIGNTIMHVPGQQELTYLKDVTEIYRGYIDPPEHILHGTGQRSLALAISMREGGNMSRLGEQINTTLEWVQSAYPVGVEFSVVLYQPGEVQRKVNDFVSNLMQSVAIVLITSLLTLGMRIGLVVASLIPMTILFTFTQMRLFDIGIDQISLAALIISLGMLVDNAIVMSESILTQIGMGKKPEEAAVDSAKELRIPLLTSSLTTSLAFLPIFLANSAAGEYTASLFKVVTISLFGSWLLSLTMTPLLCVAFLKHIKVKKTVLDKGFYALYRKYLLILLHHPILVVCGFSIAFTGALFLITLVPQSFFPPMDRSTFTVELELPEGTKIERTEEVVQGIEDFLAHKLQRNKGTAENGVTEWVAFLGGFPPRYILNFNPQPLLSEKAYLIINTTSYEAIPEIQEKLADFTAQQYPELRTIIKDIEYGPPITSKIGIRISGDSPQELHSIADAIQAKLAEIPGSLNIRDDWGGDTKKILVKINQARALRAGITSRDIAISLQTHLSGFPTTSFREDDELIPVILRSIDSDRENLAKLETLNVFSQSSAVSVPLKQVADIELEWQPSKIIRRNRRRTITVRAEVAPGFTSQAIANELQPWLKEQQQQWPFGYFWEFGGEIETSKKSNDSIIEQVPLAALFVLLLLVIQFNSFRLPIIILLTIPLGLIGVAVGLVTTQASLGFMAFLGVVSLSGIVVNNAIVLLDRIRIEQEEFGKDPHEAIVYAALVRLRPILLTTITTAGGLLPLWLGGGDLFKPMAIAIIFGLLLATALTLGFIPVLYALFFRVRYTDNERQKPTQSVRA